MLPPLTHIGRVAIIGAGPSGLAAARALLAENRFPTIDILEQRPSAGGVWNYTPETGDAPIPSENPHVAEKPVGDGEGKVFASAMYDLLETNIPKPLMAFPGHPFKKELQLFPKRKDVTEYLHEYAKDVEHLIRFNTSVTACTKTSSSAWKLSLASVRGAEKLESRCYDAVLVASGNYNIPYLPTYPGLSQLAAENPSIVWHSKNYRRPEAFASKKVLIIGNQASGLDIASQIAPHCAQPLLHSSRSTTYLNVATERPGIADMPGIVGFRPETRGVQFVDDRIEDDLDAVIFCTGYLQSLPFLESLQPPVVTDGARVEQTFRHIFYIPDPTLAFLGTPVKVIPFHIAVNQAAVVARVWSGRLQLPERKEMEAWDAAEQEAKGAGKQYRYFNFPADAEYIDQLAEWSEGAGEKEGKNVVLGIDRSAEDDWRALRWGERERWWRERFPRIRAAFNVAKKEGRIVRDMEELGFSFENGLEGGVVNGDLKREEEKAEASEVTAG